MNKMTIIDCGIVQDLLPLYIDGCCSEESRIAVDEHIESCSQCNSVLEMMKNNYITEKNEKTGVLKPTRVNGWKASVLQSVLLFLSFGVLSAGITLEAYTPYGSNNGFWAFFIIIPVASFMLSLSNWYFVRLYKNKKLFKIFSVLAALFFELCFCVWGVFHFRSTFFSLDVSHLLFIGISFGVCAVLCLFLWCFSGAYAKMLGKE